MIKRAILFLLVLVLAISVEDISAQEECTGNEELVETESFTLVVPSSDGEREFISPGSDDWNACCPSDDNCVYMGKCYAPGEIVDDNPRYACGVGNNLIEAVDYDYDTTDDEFEKATVPHDESISVNENAYPVQERPIVNLDIISCNSKDEQMPQQWMSISDCSQGTLRAEIVDGPSGNTMDRETDFRFELFKEGGFNSKEYTNFTKQKEDSVFFIEGLVGSYYNIITEVEGGNIGSVASIRVNADESFPDVTTINTYRDNTCENCVDYSLGTGLCNKNCQDRGLNNICSFQSDEISEKCHMKSPGTEVVLDDGTRVECCNEILGPKLPDVKAEIGCDMDNLVRKEYTLNWKGEPITLVVTACGEK